MPCHSEPSRESIERDERDLDAITRLACDRCKELEAAGKRVPHWAVEWWTSHKAWDDERLVKEKLEAEKASVRNRALSKLTPDERAVLDL